MFIVVRTVDDVIVMVAEALEMTPYGVMGDKVELGFKEPDYSVIRYEGSFVAPLVCSYVDGAVIINDANTYALLKLEEDMKGVFVAVQNRLDGFAQSRGYDNIVSLCTYASSAVPKFAAEGQYGVTIRDSTWIFLAGLLEDIQAGTVPVPSSYAEIEVQLPAMVWPT